MNFLLRSASVFALALPALSASASVTYSFVYGSNKSFVFTRDTYITNNTTIASFTTSTGVRSAFFDLTGRSGVPAPDIQVSYPPSALSPNGSTGYFYFSAGDFSTNGVHFSDTGGSTLTVAGQPTPEPAAFVPLGLGAIAFLRRRRA